MMPHPERVCEEILGGVDGAMLFKSVADWQRRVKA
jgi:phosphoribosylformylglycinamidine (FGAM) synthase-like amidotransferase family enzyme